MTKNTLGIGVGNQGLPKLRLVFTSDGVVVGIVDRVVRGLTTLVKIENRSRKRSHKLDRIKTLPFLPIPFTTPSLMIQ